MRQWKLAQFEFGTEGMTEFVVYTENGSKNHSGMGITVWTHCMNMRGFYWPARGFFRSTQYSWSISYMYESALGSTTSLRTLKPVPPESTPGLPPSLSHAWGVHSTSLPVDSCAFVMYSDGFMSHCISWSCTVIVYLASSKKTVYKLTSSWLSDVQTLSGAFAPLLYLWALLIDWQ